MPWISVLVGALIGAALGSLITYLLTSRFNLAVDQRIRAEKLESFEEGKIASREEIAVEREVYLRRKGMIKKVKSVVVSERILLGGLPITPFYEQERPFDEHLDADELGTAADVVRGLAGLPDLKKMGLRVIQKPLKKRLIS